MLGEHIDGCDSEKSNGKCAIIVPVIAKQNENKTKEDEAVKEHLIGTAAPLKATRSNAVVLWTIVPWFILINCLVQVWIRESTKSTYHKCYKQGDYYTNFNNRKTYRHTFKSI